MHGMDDKERILHCSGSIKREIDFCIVDKSDCKFLRNVEIT